MLGYLLPREARGSIAFIPYLASVLIVPHYTTVLAAALIKAWVEAHIRAPFQRAIFNVAQYVLNVSCAIGIYVVLGGESLLKLPHTDLLFLTKTVGLPAIIGFFV